MAGYEEIARRLEAIRSVFEESPDRVLTLNELWDQLQERGASDLFSGSGRKTGTQDAAAVLARQRQLKMLSRCLERLDDRARNDDPQVLERVTDLNGTQCWQLSGARREALREEQREFVGWAAIHALRHALDWSVPAELKNQLEDYLEEAEEHLLDTRASSPLARWLQAFRLRSGTYFYFEKQECDPAIRDLVERAIINRCQLQLRVIDDEDHGIFATENVRASVSHYVLTPPDSPTVMLWPHYEGEDADIVECIPWPLSWILSAQLLTDRPARLPVDCDKRVDGMLLNNEGLPVERDETRVVEVLVSPYQWFEWRGSWIGNRLECLEIKPDGWRHCRLVYPAPRMKLSHWEDFGDDLNLFLSRHTGQVVVVAPAEMRESYHRYAKELAARYQKLAAELDAG